MTKGRPKIDSPDPKPPFAPTTVEEVFGSATYNGPPKTLEEMEGAIAAEAKRRYDSWKSDP